MFNFLFLCFYSSSQVGWLGACRRIGWRGSWRAWYASSAYTNTLRRPHSSLQHTVGNKITSKCPRLHRDFHGETFRARLRKHYCRFQHLEHISQKLKWVAGSLVSAGAHERSAWTLSCKVVKVSSATADSVQKKPKQSPYHGQLLCSIISKEAWGNRDHSVL